MTILISLIVGLAAGCFVNYAISFRTGKARNIGICIAGALIGGALLPWALSVPGAWAAVIGSVIGTVVVLYFAAKLFTETNMPTD